MAIAQNKTMTFTPPKCFITFTEEVLKNHNGTMLTVFYVSNMLFVFITNTALIFGLVKTKNKTMTRSNKLFIFLSVSDLCVGFLLMPLLLYDLHISPNITCLEVAVRAFWISFPVILSGTHILLISVDRYLMIAKNNWYRKYFTDKVVVILIVSEFLLAFSWGFAYALVSQKVDYNRIAIYFMSLGIFEVVILVLAMRVNLMVRENVYATTQNNTTLQRSQKGYSRRLSKTILFITISLVTSYMPSVIGLITTAFFFFFSTNRTHIQNMIIVLIWLLVPASINSGLNSCIYVVRNTKIRRYFKSIIFNVEDVEENDHQSSTLHSREHLKINAEPQKLYTSQF